MKLKDLEIFVVAPPFPGWGGRYWIFPKLTTDNGIVGYGECYASTVGPKAISAKGLISPKIEPVIGQAKPKAEPPGPMTPPAPQVP